MPQTNRYAADLDTKLHQLLNYQGVTIRAAAITLGVSRSFAQRRAKLLSAQKCKTSCNAAREAAGFEPLPAGHPITWSAISDEAPLRTAAQS